VKPFAPPRALALDRAPPLAPAPARNRIRFLALAMFALLLLLSGRAVQLAFSGDPLSAARAATSAAPKRADIVDRNGVLLATTVRAYALTASPSLVWDARETAAALLAAFPELDRAATERRLADRTHTLVYLRRGLSPGERERVLALGLAGIGFEAESRREYPNGSLGAHVLGFTDVDLKPLAGVERGLDVQIRVAGTGQVRLSLDVRMQYALETELSAAARAASASGGAGILLDGRSGEVLALASWPSFDPNAAGQALEAERRDRVAGDVHELGSTIKPFTLAMALQERVTSSGEVFDLARPLDIEGSIIADHEVILESVGLRDILAQSSNIGAARLALRLGGARQRIYLDRLGLTAPARLQLGRNQAPLAPAARGRRDVAGLGFGYGLAATPAALAGAYTVFANQGARVAPTLLMHAEGAVVERTAVFSPEVTALLLAYLRAAVTDGTGRAADVPGLAIAGKTGTAEKFGAGAYVQDRNFSSFAGVFPAHDPRYVVVLALDDTKAGAAGGAVAAPAVARTLRRIAPMLGLSVAARE
jgi:cell division protein FtsI (penicillin-binding protein 3)